MCTIIIFERRQLAVNILFILLLLKKKLTTVYRYTYKTSNNNILFMVYNKIFLLPLVVMAIQNTIINQNLLAALG